MRGMKNTQKGKKTKKRDTFEAPSNVLDSVLAREYLQMARQPAPVERYELFCLLEVARLRATAVAAAAAATATGGEGGCARRRRRRRRRSLSWYGVRILGVSGGKVGVVNDHSTAPFVSRQRPGPSKGRSTGIQNGGGGLGSLRCWGIFSRTCLQFSF